MTTTQEPALSGPQTATGDPRVDAYLARIGYDGGCAPTLETLRGMHRAHFLHVPFENLDIGRRVPLSLVEQTNFEKIVGRHRGGFCLEVNGLFASVLQRIGFRVDVLGARVFTDGALGPALTHMTLLVHLDEPWIADVGFGGRIIEPLRLAERAPQFFGERSYTVANDDDHWFVTAREPGTPPMTYTFTLRGRSFDEFRSACDWLQTSPDSRFTQADIVSLGTEDGRRSLAADRLIVTEREERRESELGSPAERSQVLRDRFGLVL